MEWSAVSVMYVKLFNPILPRSIATRLNCIVAISLAAVFGLAAASLHFSRTAVDAANGFQNAGVLGLATALEFDTLLERHQRLVETATRDAGLRVPAALIRRQQDHIERQMVRGLSDRSQAVQDELRILIPRLGQATRTVLENTRGGASALLEPLAAYGRASAHLHATVRSERREIIERMRARVAELTATATQLADWVRITALVALVLIGPVSLVLLRRVTRRLRIITRSMVRLSRNDFDGPVARASLVKADGPDEIGDLARALDVFRGNAIALRAHRGRLEQVNLWLDVALNNMQRGLAMFDADERLVVSNANYQRMYDLPVTLTLHGTPLADILAHRAENILTNPSEIIASYRLAVAARAPATFIRDRADGRTYCVTLTPLDDGGWVTAHEDVTEKRQADARARLLARQDSLTELQNRRGFSEALTACAGALPADDAPDPANARFALLSIDLDHFKEVNDTYGHPTGDALLVAVADRLRSAVRQDDIVARMGGDEFAILQRSVRGVHDPERLVRRLLPLLSEPYDILGHKLMIGASIGLSLAPAHGRVPELLMQRADLALYSAKTAGRNNFVFFDDALETPVLARREMERDLRAAIAAGDLTLHYQPIVSLRDRAVDGCEALLRWQRRNGSHVSPADFIPLAEEVGLIGDLGAWVLREACKTAVTWPDTIKIAVNLSPLQFVGSALLDHVKDALKLSGLAAHRLELEITESTLLQDNATTLATLHALRALGVAIALDDFGTGYSSLSYLRAFPFNKLKIDRSFVRDLPDRPDCAAIVTAVATLAESLQMTTVAEGVETHDQLMRVHRAGCTAVQGYLFSRPVAADALAEVFELCAAKLAA
jgi:diguanylate cyclase (GGDEF)-like protein